MKPGDVDLDEAVRMLPAPYFQMKDIYNIGPRLGVPAHDCPTLWWVLRREKRIKKTTIPCGKGYYWQRERD